MIAMKNYDQGIQLLEQIEKLIEFCKPNNDLSILNEHTYIALVENIQELGTSWENIGCYSKFISMNSDSIDRNISNAQYLDFDTTVATLICIGRELHWNNYSNAIFKRIPNGSLYRLSSRLKETLSNPKIYDRKREYLIKTLSRTKKKDYENYIVNAIWHKLNRLDIQPVTQQYIKRSDGKYALVDLYFPQIKYAIECDEAYHIKNKYEDEKRQLTMEEILSSYDESSDFILRRISAYQSMASIELQIDKVVSEIKEVIKKCNLLSWDIDVPAYELALRTKWIGIDDGLRYDTISDICRCFGKDYKNIQKSFFNINHKYTIWCPQLAVIKDNQLISPAVHGWINYLSDDWEIIYEKNQNVELERNKITDREKKPRITFAKCQNPFGKPNYRFIGVFNLDGIENESALRIYKRSATGLSLGMF